MKHAAAVLVIVAAALLGVCEGFLWYALKPERHNTSDRAWVDSVRTCGALRDTFILNQEGDSLHGWYVRSQCPEAPTAILVHGYSACALWMGHIASIYDRSLHCNILLPDLHGHGDTPGEWVQMGWKDRLDVLAWCRVAEHLFGTRSIVLHGVSMGAATVMCVGGCTESNDPGRQIPPTVKCIVEDCGYTSVWDEFQNQLEEQFGVPAFPLMHMASALCKVQLGWSFGEASPLAQVAKCQVPMLFIHGGDDAYVRTEMVHRLYDAKPGEKALWIAPGSAHARSIDDHPEDYAAHVTAFTRKYIGD